MANLPDATFGLSERAVNLLIALFAAEPLIQKVVIYGSRAKGNYREGSDIDISLDAPNLDAAAFSRLCTAADDLLLPWGLDISLMHQIDNPELLSHIARVGKVLWQNPHPLN